MEIMIKCYLKNHIISVLKKNKYSEQFTWVNLVIITLKVNSHNQIKINKEQIW